MSTHTTFRKGTRVFVVLKDGTKFDDKFIEKKGKFVYLRKRGKVPVADLRAMTFFKHKGTEI